MYYVFFFFFIQFCGDNRNSYDGVYALSLVSIVNQHLTGNNFKMYAVKCLERTLCSFERERHLWGNFYHDRNGNATLYLKQDVYNLQIICICTRVWRKVCIHVRAEDVDLVFETSLCISIEQTVCWGNLWFFLEIVERFDIPFLTFYGVRKPTIVVTKIKRRPWNLI